MLLITQLICWKENIVRNSSRVSIHQLLLDILLENSLVQFVDGITRLVSENTLDLLLASNPTLVTDVCILPGISDHNIVTFSISGNPRTCHIPPRKTYQFHKANLPELRKAVADFSEDFLSSSPETRSVDENWTCITAFINKCRDQFIPSKMSRTRRSLPWITVSLKRQMRKRDRLFKRARSHPSTTNWKSYLQLRKQVSKHVH